MASNFEISDDKFLLQVDWVHKKLADTYWSKGIPRSTVLKAIGNSLCFGVYVGGQQAAFARVVTDQATFAWLCDVVVEEDMRGQGLGKALMTEIMRHPSLQGLRRICLATKDAHTLYERFGFKVTESPGNWMEIKDNEIYSRG